MNGIIYAFEVGELTYSGLRIKDVKIGRTTNVESTISQYKRSSRHLKPLRMWRPNPEKSLSVAERGVHEIAEKYATERQGEKFVFLQGDYEKFASTVDKMLQHTTKEDLSDSPGPNGIKQSRDYTGTTPGAIKILGETHGVENWTETLVTAMTKILNDVENQEKVTEIKGTKRSYFVQKSEQSNLISPKKIPDSDLYVESNFSAKKIVRLIEQVMKKYGYDISEFEVLFLENR